MDSEPSRVVRELKGRKVEFGGEEHSGWLPSRAARPRPTPVEIATVDFAISKVDGGYIFEWYARNTTHRGDTWHETLEDAIAQARLSFGIEPGEWQSSGSGGI